MANAIGCQSLYFQGNWKRHFFQNVWWGLEKREGNQYIKKLHLVHIIYNSASKET